MLHSSIVHDVLKHLNTRIFFPEGQTHWKDLSLITLFIGCSIGAWYGWKQDKKFKHHLNRMNRDMEGLQSAERALETLQKELEFAKQAKEDVANEKETLERKLQESGGDLSTLHGSYSDLEVSHLKAEIEASTFLIIFLYNSSETVCLKNFNCLYKRSKIQKCH